MRWLILAALLSLLTGGGLLAKEFFMQRGVQGVSPPPVISAVPTFTFQNDSGGTLPAGTPVSFGMAFRYDDIKTGNYPLIRDASTHAALAGQQWDEVSTWRENGGDGSWRHAVWAILLPNSLANGATYQIEFVPTPVPPPGASMLVSGSTPMLVSPGIPMLVHH